jgi:hypothetical protein
MAYDVPAVNQVWIDSDANLIKICKNNLCP